MSPVQKQAAGHHYWLTADFSTCAALLYGNPQPCFKRTNTGDLNKLHQTLLLVCGPVCMKSAPCSIEAYIHAPNCARAAVHLSSHIVSICSVGVMWLCPSVVNRASLSVSARCSEACLLTDHVEASHRVGSLVTSAKSAVRRRECGENIQDSTGE